jgi:hypothetical protein
MPTYEKTVPSLTATVSLDGQPLGATKFSTLKDAPAVFSRPNGALDAGKRAQAKIERVGDGRIYYATHLSFKFPHGTFHWHLLHTLYGISDSDPIDGQFLEFATEHHVFRISSDQESVSRGEYRATGPNRT